MTPRQYGLVAALLIVMLLGTGAFLVTQASRHIEIKTERSADGSSVYCSLGNPTNRDAQDVVLKASGLANFEVSNISPPPTSITVDEVIWDQGILESQRQFDVTIDARPRSTGAQLTFVGQWKNSSTPPAHIR